MSSKNYEIDYLKVGRSACIMVFVFGMFYTLVTITGLLSLKSPLDTIGEPFFSIMEISSILIALLMTISIAAVHYHTSPTDKFFSLTSLMLMLITTGITSCVHFVILSIGQNKEFTQIQGFNYFLSFKWPSIVYALDILAWDLFFGLSLLFIAPTFKKGKLEKKIKFMLIVSGALSLTGLIGVPLQNMHIRNIGIIGYAVIAPFAFLFMGKNLGYSIKPLNK